MVAISLNALLVLVTFSTAAFAAPAGPAAVPGLYPRQMPSPVAAFYPTGTGYAYATGTGVAQAFVARDVNYPAQAWYPPAQATASYNWPAPTATGEPAWAEKRGRTFRFGW